MIDKNRVKVKEGDSIKFTNSSRVYKVTLKDNVLGCYEDDKFIPLHEVLRNYEVINRG